MKSINPATGEVVREYHEMTELEVENRLTMAEETFLIWRQATFENRAERLRSLAELLLLKKDKLARLMTTEMGKPIGQSEAEVEKCAWVCNFYADHAHEFLADTPIATDASRSYIRYDPLGPILAIMPWNFPLWQVFRFAAPNLMAGNVGVLKHAANVCGCALAIEELFAEADFLAGMMNCLLIPSSRVSDVIRHRAIRGVTLTGSDRAGAEVAAEAGRQLKKTVLELGGSDPFLVLSNADPQQAAELAVRARTVNSGQSCIAAKRFLVEQPVAEEFTRAFVHAMQELTVGDPFDRQTDIGPLAREDLMDALDSQIQRSVQAGAELLTGGRRLDRAGFYYPPTVLKGVQPGMPVFDEETFGPVAAIVEVADRQNLIRLANRSVFGLGAAICSENVAEAEELAGEIEAGSVFINEAVRSDPRLPFGGVKRSGYGRELSAIGAREFTNVKTIWVR